MELQQALRQCFSALTEHRSRGRLISDLFLTKPSREIYPDYYQVCCCSFLFLFGAFFDIFVIIRS